MSTRPTPQFEEPATLPSALDAETWLNEHGDALYRYARTRVGKSEVAEDLVQETFLAALQARNRFEGRSTVRSWLVSILRNKIVDYYRRAEDARLAAEPALSDRAARIADHSFTSKGFWRKIVSSWKSPEQALEDREFWDVLDGCLRRLPRAFAAVFVLRELEGLEMSDLRGKLAVTEGNIRVRLHRARLLLRECLEKQWFAETPEAPGRPR